MARRWQNHGITDLVPRECPHSSIKTSKANVSVSNSRQPLNDYDDQDVCDGREMENCKFCSRRNYACQYTKEIVANRTGQSIESDEVRREALRLLKAQLTPRQIKLDCDICCMVFNTPDELGIHVRSHSLFPIREPSYSG